MVRRWLTILPFTGIILFASAQQQPKQIGGSVSAPILIHIATPDNAPLLKKNLTGSIVITFWVETDGSTSHIKVVHGLGKEIDRNAVEAVGQYRFKPAMEKGSPVVVQFSTEISFPEVPAPVGPLRRH
jgi:protein TonB